MQPPSAAQELAGLKGSLGGYGAAVYDIDVGLLPERNAFVTSLAKQLQHLGGFVLIDLAAEGFQRYGSIHDKPCGLFLAEERGA